MVAKILFKEKDYIREMNIFDEINIKYKIKDQEEIKIFGKEFVKNNKNICKIIYEDKEYDLSEYIKINNKKEKLEIKLNGISNINNMSNMFYECSTLLSLSDISKWDTSNIMDISYIFGGFELLEYLPDISKWNISNVKYMQGMLMGCKSLKKLPDISNWDTSNVIYMGGSFSDLLPLTHLNNSNYKELFRTGMFFRFNLSSLPDISKWNISKVIHKRNMIGGNKSLLSLSDIVKYKRLDKEEFERIEKEKEKEEKKKEVNKIYDELEDQFYISSFKPEEEIKEQILSMDCDREKIQAWLETIM